jgi:hypothetical protein
MSNIELHDWSLDMSTTTHRIGLGAGAVFAGALMSLATASTAGADPIGAAGAAVTADQFSDLFTREGTQADRAVDNFYQGIANFFAPESMGSAAAQAAGVLTGEGNPLDQAVDNFYQGVANFFNPEAVSNTLTIDQFSDMLAGEGTMADQMVDNMYQMISTAFAPEGPIDMFLDPLLGITP